MDITRKERIERFRSLYDDNARQVRRICANYTYSSWLAEESSQETWIKVFNKLHTIREKPAHWISRVARNTAISYGIKDHAQDFTNDVDADTLESNDTPERAMTEERQHKVFVRALNSVSRDTANILLLSARDGLSYTVIADLTGLPIGTVRSRISRAKRLVRSRL